MTLLDKLYALYSDQPIATLRSATVWDVWDGYEWYVQDAA